MNAGSHFSPIAAFLERITRPHPAITLTEQRREARLVASLTLLMSILSTFAWALPRINPVESATFATYATGVALLLGYGLYGVSRTRRYRWATYWLIILAFLGTLLPGITGSNPPALFMIPMALLMSAMLLSLRVTLLMGILATLAAAGRFLTVPDAAANSLYINAVSFNLMITGIITVMVYYRNMQERDRRLELEVANSELRQHQDELVKGQAELKQAVEALQSSQQALRDAADERERLNRQVVEAQRQALKELSTPIIPLLDDVIIVPLIGSLDGQRAHDLTRALLAGITRHRARIVILDVTGVPAIDSGVAAHLAHTIQAARLKGARTILTGITNSVAETIIDLGIDWQHIDTQRDLQSGVRLALAQTGSSLFSPQ